MFERIEGAEATPAEHAGALATPEDDYDPRWGEYYKQNPHLRRSVGAAAADGEGDGDAGEEGGEDGGEGDGKGDGEAGDKGGGAGEGEGGEGGGEEDPGRKAGSHFSDAYEDEGVKKIAARYNTEADMAKALKDANTELSQRLKIPGKDASEEDVAKFRKQLGVPDKIEDYAVKKPDFMSDEAFNEPVIQGVITSVVEAMHKTGASKATVDATLGAYWAMEAAAAEATKKADTEAEGAAEAALRAEWGENYDANIAFANVAAESFPDLASLELKDGTLVGSNPHFAKVLATIGRQNSEGGMHAGFLNTEAGADLKSTYDALTVNISKAHAIGDKVEVERLDAERRKISEKLHGTSPIAGQSL